MTDVPTSLPWWRSRVIIGAIVSIASKLLVATGAVGEISPEDEGRIADIAVLLVGGVADLVVITARVRQEHAPPITAKKAG